MSSLEGYKRFRSWVAQQRITVDVSSEKIWKYYDFGPKEEALTPLIFLPGVSGTAEIFYKQFLSLCPKGYRLISVQYPPFMDHTAWCKGFDRFLDKMQLNKVHLFGTSLGGYLGQCFVMHKPERVLSLVLCNTYADTQYYKDNAPCVQMFPVMPEFMLKRMILSNFPTKIMEVEITNSVDFMVQQLETLNQAELASRLTLNCTVAEMLKPAEFPMDKSKITIMDTLDEVAVPERVRDEVYKFYPDAKFAELKTGGNFPYLSRSDEVNLHLQVHLRNHGVLPNPMTPPEILNQEKTSSATEEKKEEKEEEKEEKEEEKEKTEISEN